jgi:GntR family transcriptional repressor for pyruvate dehydrogenase complex
MMRETPLMPQRDVKEHLAILAAIRRRNAEEAREAMIAHIRSSARAIEIHEEAAAV